MTLAADAYNPTQEGSFIDLPMVDNDIIYKGALVIVDSNGYAAPMTGAVLGGHFAGIAEEQADNTITGHTAGGIRCKIKVIPHRRKMAVTGAAQNMIGHVVHASADDTLTMTETNTTTPVGIFVDYISSGIGVVLFQPCHRCGVAVAEAGGANPSAAEFKALLDSLVAAGLLNKV